MGTISGSSKGWRLHHPQPPIRVCPTPPPSYPRGRACPCLAGIVSALNRLGRVVVYDTEFNSGDYLREKVSDVVKDAMRVLSPPQG